MWRHGLTMSEIARRRGTSRYGIRYHLRNAAEKLGVSSTATLRHWPGFPVDSARTREANMPVQMQLGPLGQVSMLCRSATHAEQWYRDVLGLAHVFTFGDLIFFDLNGVRLYIHQVANDEWRPSSVLYFLVSEIGVAHGQLLERGVRFSGAPHMIHRDESTGVEEWMAFFEDPDGNTLAIMARTSPVFDAPPT